MATSYDLKVLFNESKDESEETEQERGWRRDANWTVCRKLQLNLLCDAKTLRLSDKLAFIGYYSYFLKSIN